MAKLFTMYKIHQILTFWTCSLCLVLGHGLGPTYTVSQRFCESSSECNTDAGEVCWWLYDGCRKGQCMCDPGKQIADENGICRSLRLGGEACSTEDLCPKEMSCQKGVCKCLSGRMTPDGTFCLNNNYQLLGEKCDPAINSCWHKASFGYTKIEAECSYTGVCKCAEGLKQDAIRCRKWKIGEYGCTESYHCMGGALCLRGQCRCPNAYDSVAGNTKCAKRGATINLPLSATCDEFNERRYCGKSLVCNTCAGEAGHKCVRYLISEEKTYVNMSCKSQISTVLLLVTAVVSFLLSQSR